MLIDGEKWACEACVRGHRVSTCKHNDRPLIRINRKGRPFSTCSICNCTPCPTPEEHNKLKREAEMESQPQNKAAGKHTRSNPSAFLPIAPRPASASSRAIQTTPSPGYIRGSQCSNAAPTAAAPAATGAVGGRGAPQDAPQQRTNNPTSRSPTTYLSQQQLYAPQPEPNHYSGMDPLNIPLGSITAPPPGSMCDASVSMSRVNPFDTAENLSLSGDNGPTAFLSLDGIDLSALHENMLQEDWTWFSEDTLR